MHHRIVVITLAAVELLQLIFGITRMLAGEGDLLPVSALPADGTFPTGTARWEKRSLADAIPVWDPDLCIDCGKCAIVCPHAAIRMKAYPEADLAGAPDGFKSKAVAGRDLPAGTRLKDGKLVIMKTPNGENPLMHGASPILGCDVWEHSYYIDYRNLRPKYLEAFVDNLVNWDYVDEMFSKA